MLKYKCINEECEEFGKEIQCIKGRISIVAGKIVDSNTACPKCGKDREDVPDSQPGFCTTFYGTSDQLRRQQKG